MPGMSGLELQAQLNAERCKIPIIFITAHGDEKMRMQALRAGAVEFLSKPFDEEVLLESVRAAWKVKPSDGTVRPSRAGGPQWQLMRRLSKDRAFNDQDRNPRRFEQVVGNSSALELVFEQVELVAPTDSTVLIQGETGTGKELIARAIHNISSRCGRPFVKLNCAAIPFDLLESELFGHEKGAFTGAIAQKVGRFELADKGTLFLDEVGDIPLGTATQTAARFAGTRVRALRRHPDSPGGCSSCGCDQPRFGEHGEAEANFAATSTIV